MFDDFGGAATCPHFGRGGRRISCGFVVGNGSPWTLSSASASWPRLAHQVQNVSAMASNTGDTMSAHRSTLFGSHTWQSRAVPGAVLGAVTRVCLSLTLAM